MERIGAEVPIVGIDKTDLAFLDKEGNRYFEVDVDVFAREDSVFEGAVGYHGSGSHGGHIVLKPFYVYEDDRWVIHRYSS